ncbi:hypothetical protein [Amycolatopsis sp. GA6-003]|uniref:hypothetical protein n=1 Tax=Amycolatopsis sp. GA6-003 TaxID=2652444 RepID=UPI003916D116
MGLRLKIGRSLPVRRGIAVCVPVGLRGVSAARWMGMLMLRAGMVVPLWTAVRWRIVRP